MQLGGRAYPNTCKVLGSMPSATKPKDKVITKDKVPIPRKKNTLQYPLEMTPEYAFHSQTCRCWNHINRVMFKNK